MQIVIPSRGRPGNVPHMNMLFPTAKWCVSKEDVDSYENMGMRNFVAHPNDVLGLGAKRNWIMEHFDDETVVQVDDDIQYAVCVVGIRSRPIFMGDQIEAIVGQAAQCAKDAGASVFGFNQGSDDVRKFSSNAPFGLTGWVGTVIGTIGKRLHFDPSLRSRVDIDFCLKCLDKDRLIWRDNRFSFVNKRIKNVGGSQGVRTALSDRAEVDKLKARWGQNLTVVEGKGEIIIKVNALRS
jgi:glycosyltransferase involved in cell wall biosynthesis